MPRPAAPAFLDPGLIETTIERIVPGGLGMAHVTGRTIFVRGAAPGDRVKVQFERSRGAVAHARIAEILAPGPDRVEPEHAAVAACGLADFAHLSYPAQLAAKAAMITDALRRNGGITLDDGFAVTASPAEWRYRLRAEWHHDHVQPAFGVIEAEQHRVVDLEQDPLVVSALGEVFRDLHHQAWAGSLPPEVTTVRAAAGVDGVSIPRDDDGGAATITAAVGEERLSFDATCFFQSNVFLLEALLAEALWQATPDGAKAEPVAIDLYAGVGLFTLGLARRFPRVVAVEAHEGSAAYLAGNAMLAGLRGVRVMAQPVEAWLPEGLRTFGRPELVVVDPPRAGLSEAARRGIVRLRPERITYVSCDPVTLARDLKALISEGWELVRVAALDMFPQTHHVETVAHLRKR